MFGICHSFDFTPENQTWQFMTTNTCLHVQDTSSPEVYFMMHVISIFSFIRTVYIFLGQVELEMIMMMICDNIIVVVGHYMYSTESKPRNTETTVLILKHSFSRSNPETVTKTPWGD